MAPFAIDEKIGGLALIIAGISLTVLIFQGEVPSSILYYGVALFLVSSGVYSFTRMRFNGLALFLGALVGAGSIAMIFLLMLFGLSRGLVPSDSATLIATIYSLSLVVAVLASGFGVIEKFL